MNASAITDIISRKNAGIRINKEESSIVMAEFDSISAYDPYGVRLAQEFPREFARWGEEVENDTRFWKAR